MTRKEFEDWLDANNFRTVYDTSYEPYRYCNGTQEFFEIGTYGCYESDSKWFVKSYKGALGDRPSTNYRLSYEYSIDTEEEALEILKANILQYEHETICANYEKNISAFIEEIKGKKIQSYFTYENNNCDLTRKDLDVLIGKYFKDCSYGFPKGTEQSLYIIHNNTHRPILCIKWYYTQFPKEDLKTYIPIIYEYMNKKIIFLGNVSYELSYAHYDFQVDSTGIYLLESNSIKKFDFNGKRLWEKEMKFNSPNVRFATNRELLIKEYNLAEYIGIIDLENLHIVSKGNEPLVKYKDIVCKIEENDDTIYLIPKMIYEQFKKVFGEDASIYVSPEDERINNQEEELVKLLKQKILDYGFEEIDGEYKLQVYEGENFNRVKVGDYGLSYGFFELKKDNEIIYAYELLTGFADTPVYIQLTKKEYDAYIDKLNGKENVELPKIDESERCFCDNYRNTGKNYFSYNDVFHEVSEDKKKKLNMEELKEFSQEITRYPTFKFYFPKSMGEYCKQNDNVFELRKDNIQKIRVMISKCSSEENLEADAKKWIEFNKKETNMEELSYKKEKINNIPIEVYELKKIGKNGTRIYKIGYVNGCRITISGGKVEGKEEIINKAFEKITWIDSKSNNEKKVDETNKTKTPIIVDCPACKNNFELKWNIPATEKTFYCKCPNCGMELKRGNPNYKETDKI